MRYAEVDGAINSPLCMGTNRKAEAVYIADLRPYHDDTARAQEHIAYYVRNGITEPMIRADMGFSFGGIFPIPNCPLSAQDSPQHIADGYASGCLDYKKRIILGDWHGCEYERFCAMADLFVAARLKPIVLFNVLGEATLDLWAADPTTETGQRVLQTLRLLAANPRAIARGMTTEVDNPRENWDKPYPFLRKVMNATCFRIMQDSPLFDCPFIVSGACAVPIVRDDGRTQPPCEMMRYQVSHAGAYSHADAATAYCVDAKHRHVDGYFPNYALNLNAQDCPPEQVANRDRFGALDYSILWANKVSDVEACLALVG